MLSDPEEFERIKNIYVEPRYLSDRPNWELKEAEERKEAIKKNQAR